jgi:hypothetical protein
VVGVVLLIIGANAANSLGDKATYLFVGRLTDRTTWFIIGGIALSLAGLLMVIFGGRRNRD